MSFHSLTRELSSYLNFEQRTGGSCLRRYWKTELKPKKAIFTSLLETVNKNNYGSDLYPDDLIPQKSFNQRYIMVNYTFNLKHTTTTSSWSNSKRFGTLQFQDLPSFDIRQVSTLIIFQICDPQSLWIPTQLIRLMWGSYDQFQQILIDL